MKLKCDLIIQNFNDPVNRQVAGNQDKVHKGSTLGLYRPRQDDDDENEYDPESFSASKPQSSAAARSIILTIETKTHSFKYKLKKVETFTKFIQEGRATLKLTDENIFLLISNCTSLTLINFISLLNVKIAKSQLASGPVKAEKKTYVSKLLSNAEFTMGRNNLAVISPLNQAEIDAVMKAKNARLAAATGSGFACSPVRAGGSFARPSTFKRSLSSLSVNADEGAKGRTSTFKRYSTCLNDAHTINKMPRSTSSANLLIELTEEQKYVVKSVKEGRSVFFTGKIRRVKSPL